MRLHLFNCSCWCQQELLHFASCSTFLYKYVALQSERAENLDLCAHMILFILFYSWTSCCVNRSFNLWILGCTLFTKQKILYLWIRLAETLQKLAFLTRLLVSTIFCLRRSGARLFYEQISLVQLEPFPTIWPIQEGWCSHGLCLIIIISVQVSLGLGNIRKHCRTMEILIISQ